MIRAAVLVVLVALVGTACGGATFSQDDRLSIAAPREGATVELPLQIRWEDDGIATAEPGRDERGKVYFAAFVDRPPLGPGQSLLRLVERECASAGHGCATRDYFAQRNVYLTTQPGVRIDTLPVQTEHRRDAYLHRVTVVLMDGRNRRVGEAAWTRAFRVVGQ